MTGEHVIDGFAGPGGWDVAARRLGLDPLGIELDDAACATRVAAGLRTLQADLSALDPLRFAPVRGLIFSPPCQAFSMAGKGAGRKALAAYGRAIRDMSSVFEGGSLHPAPWGREQLDKACEDPRAHLVLEPLRWTLALKPEWLACEQVEPVLPLWEEIARALRERGYRTWCGVLSAERYGVPQTRRRAILMASLSRQPVEPVASHQRYVPPRVKAKQGESLFDAPEPERIVLPEDRGLLPWVSMAEALGWSSGKGVAMDPRAAMGQGMIERHGPRDAVRATEPALVITSKSRSAEWRPDDQVGFPRRADAGSSVEIDGEEYRRRDFRRASEPAFALTEKARSAVRLRANAQRNAASRAVDEPAPTITGGHDTADRVWVTDTGNTQSGSRSEGRSRRTDEPAPVVTSRADQLEYRDEPPEDRVAWVADRPATTVAGDPRVFPPGHKVNEEDLRAGRGGQRRSGAGWTDQRPAPTVVGTRRSKDGPLIGRQLPRGEGENIGGRDWVDGRPEHQREREPRDPDWPTKRPSTTVAGDPRLAQPGHKNEEAMPDCPGRMEGAIRVSVDEAAVLQDFPRGYPWQGSRTAVYRQIGDAIPSGLARAVLEGLL